MNNLIQRIKPPGKWQLPVIMMMGVFAGLSVYIFIISNAASYLSDDPETCINCHVMNPQYASWQHSSHREVANCNDCHVPHNNVLNKYFFKAKDGMRHSSMFTLRMEPQVIRIKDAGRKVVHLNCIRCHGELLEDPQLQAMGNFDHYLNRTERECWDCHRETPHGRVNSLSATPNASVPSLGNPVPFWLQKLLEENNTSNNAQHGK